MYYYSKSDVSVFFLSFFSFSVFLFSNRENNALLYADNLIPSNLEESIVPPTSMATITSQSSSGEESALTANDR